MADLPIIQKKPDPTPQGNFFRTLAALADEGSIVAHALCVLTGDGKVHLGVHDHPAERMRMVGSLGQLQFMLHASEHGDRTTPAPAPQVVGGQG